MERINDPFGGQKNIIAPPVPGKKRVPYVRYASAQISEPLPVYDSLCGSVIKDFVYHVCGHEFESRLK